MDVWLEGEGEEEAKEALSSSSVDLLYTFVVLRIWMRRLERRHLWNERNFVKILPKQIGNHSFRGVWYIHKFQQLMYRVLESLEG